MNAIPDFKRVSFEFMITEIQSGLTFANLAQKSYPKEPGKIQRDTANARKAYDNVLHFLQKISFTEEETEKIQAGLGQLKSALQALGESL